MDNNKEPWSFACDDQNVAQVSCGDENIADVWVGIEAAERIAQCVNACAGIADPERFISDARSYSHETVSAIVRQRDELLGALEDLERTSGQGAMSDDPCRIKARAAIANAKGA